jgi:hypothetical protein
MDAAEESSGKKLCEGLREFFPFLALLKGAEGLSHREVHETRVASLGAGEVKAINGQPQKLDEASAGGRRRDVVADNLLLLHGVEAPSSNLDGDIARVYGFCSAPVIGD